MAGRRSKAARAAERGYLVTLGIVPTNPATGYGYIKAAAPLHAASRTALRPRQVMCSQTIAACSRP